VVGCRADLKTLLSYAMHNQSCLGVTKWISNWFRGDILGQEIPNLYDTYNIIHRTTVLYDELHVESSKPWSDMYLKTA